MNDSLSVFEKIVRRVAEETGVPTDDSDRQAHPFDERNIHPDISSVSLSLFNNGHYSQATFEAFKYLDVTVKNLSGIQESGFNLMMAALAETNPKVKLTALNTQSEIDEQKGYKFIFAGAMSAIRNPRGHDIANDPIDRCLDHLSFASVLLRRLESLVT